jgi:hypothetical protein
MGLMSEESIGIDRAVGFWVGEMGLIKSVEGKG